jgi:hypothetical protein
MFTQIKRFAVAFAMILFLIGAMPTALAQMNFSAELDQASEAWQEDRVFDEYSFFRREDSIEILYGPKKNKVTVRLVDTSELHEYTCEFNGTVTDYMANPYPTHTYYWFRVVGTLTWSNSDIPASGKEYYPYGTFVIRDYVTENPNGDEKDNFTAYFDYSPDTTRPHIFCKPHGWGLVEVDE